MLHSPANPFSYFGGGQVLASALEVFAHAAAPRGKPAFGIEQVVVDGREVAVREELVVTRPFGETGAELSLFDMNTAWLVMSRVVPVANTAPSSWYAVTLSSSAPPAARTIWCRSCSAL